MMKEKPVRSFLLLILVFTVAACNQRDSGKTATDTTAIKKDTVLIKLPQLKDNDAKKADSAVIDTLSLSILKALKAKDYKQIATYMHPVLGLRFAPYGHIDTAANKAFSTKELLQLAKIGKKIKWGIFDGSGEPIVLSLDAYFKRFVYDVDFLKAEKISFNKMAGSANSANNIQSVYPGADFIEYYFSGFKQEYEGMDWRALRLVFLKKENKTYLVAIIHDQWTI